MNEQLFQTLIAAGVPHAQALTTAKGTLGVDPGTGRLFPGLAQRAVASAVGFSRDVVNPCQRAELVKTPFKAHEQTITAALGPSAQGAAYTEYASLISGKTEIQFDTASRLEANRNRLFTYGTIAAQNKWGNATLLHGRPWPKTGDNDWWQSAGLAFWLDGDEVSISYIDNTTNKAFVFVDGCTVQGAAADGSISNSVASSANAPQWVKITLPERKRWLIVVPRSNVKSVVIKNTDQILPVTYQGKALIFGDSFASWRIATGETPKTSRGMAATALESLGWDVLDCSTGGTGFIADAGGRTNGKLSYTDMIDYVVDVGGPFGFDPNGVDLVWLYGSGNDGTGVSVDQYKSVIAKAVAKFPKARVVVTSVYEGYNSTANAEVMNDKLKTAVDAFDGLVLWVPVDSKYHPKKAPMYWGTGSVPATAGNGNADLYFSNATQGAGDRHPNVAGVVYGSNYLASELVRAGVPYSPVVA